MKKLGKPLIFLLAIILLFVFREPLIEKAIVLWNLDDDTRGKLNDWLDIVTKIGGILGAIWLGTVWIWQTPEQDDSNPTTVNDAPPAPPDQQSLLKLYYQRLHKTCERIDLSLVDTKFTEYARSVESSITLPVVYQEMEVLPCRSERESGEDTEGRMRLQGQERRPLMQASAQNNYRRVVVLGDPGSGKSMFIDNLAWQVSGTHIGEIDERLPAKFHRQPIVRVRLRSAALLCKQDDFDIRGYSLRIALLFFLSNPARI